MLQKKLSLPADPVGEVCSAVVDRWVRASRGIPSPQTHTSRHLPPIRYSPATLPLLPRKRGVKRGEEGEKKRGRRGPQQEPENEQLALSSFQKCNLLVINNVEKRPKGRFSGVLGGDFRGGGQNWSRRWESIRMVTGPSLMRDTCISAPNCPVCTGCPKAWARWVVNCS